jgi:hypothetical protein
MENLAIVQHRDILRYACIRSGAYRPQLQWFKVCNYLYLQHEAPRTLDVLVGRSILRVKAILSNRVFFLEGKDGQKYRDNTKNYAPCQLPIEGDVYPKLTINLLGYKCIMYAETKGATTMSLYDLFQQGWHMACL